MESFFEKLASGVPRSAGSAEKLKLLGKQAAALYVEGRVSNLNAAVSKVASEEGLSREEVRRVSETANQATWNSMFRDGGDHEASFIPADSDRVLDSLATKAEQVRDPSTDWFVDPPKEPLPDIDLGEAFGVSEESEEYPRLNPLAEADRLEETAKAAAETLRYSVDRIKPVFEESRERFYQMFKQAHLKYGHGVLQIAKALSAVLDSPAFAEGIVKEAAERLMSEGVQIDTRVELEKLAQPVVVDTDHPMLKLAAQYEQAARAYAKVTNAKAKLENAHSKTSTYLHDKLRSL